MKDRNMKSDKKISRQNPEIKLLLQTIQFQAQQEKKDVEATRTIPVSQIEFTPGGNTLYIHSKSGGTVLRIRCTGTILIDRCSGSPISHGDITVKGDINLCMATDSRRKTN